jgi:hypothetical protein
MRVLAAAEATRAFSAPFGVAGDASPAAKQSGLESFQPSIFRQ